MLSVFNRFAENAGDDWSDPYKRKYVGILK